MQVSVTQMRRAGTAVPRERLPTEAQVTGCLRVEELTDEEARRAVRTARLFALDRPLTPDLLTPLRDANLLWMGQAGFVLSGLEDLGGRLVAQAWWCRPA